MADNREAIRANRELLEKRLATEDLKPYQIRDIEARIAEYKKMEKKSDKSPCDK